MSGVGYHPTMNSTAIEENSAALAIETSGASGSVAIGRGRNLLGAQRFTRPRAHAAEFLPSIETLCREHGIKPAEIAWVFVSAGPGSFTGLRIGITAARTLALAVGARIVALPTLEVIAQNALDLAEPPPRVAVMLDAKRARVYTATFSLVAQHDRNNGSRVACPSPASSGAGMCPEPHGGAALGHATRRIDRVDAPGSDTTEFKRYVAVDEPREADPATYLAAQGPDCAVMGEGVLYHRAAVSGSGLRVLLEELFPPKVETVYRLGVERAAKGMVVPARDLIPVYIRPPEAEEVWAAKHG